MSRFATGNALTVGRLNGDLEGTAPIERLTLNAARSNATGTQNDKDFDLLATSPQVGISVIEWAGASDVTWTGIANGAGGRVKIIKNKTAAKTITLPHQNAGSVAANRFITPNAGSLIVRPGWTAVAIYDATDSRWDVSLLAAPEIWTTPAFAAGSFTASGSMTWTVAAGDVDTFGYLRTVKGITFSWYLNTTTVAGTPSTGLLITMPVTAARKVAVPFTYFDTGTWGIGTAITAAGSAVLTFWKSDFTNWAASTNNTGLFGTITFDEQ